MAKTTPTFPSQSTYRFPLLIAILVVLFSLALMPTASAGPPEPSYQGPETCAKCHQEETEAWQNSPHAKALISLEQAQDTSCDAGAEACRDCLACHTTDFDPEAGTFTFGGVTCEACHGPYIPDHPQNGPMQLTVDSSVCQACHTETFQQWANSLHAQAGVQCIGCHLSHSQDFRLTDVALCGACHGDQLEDFAHTAHNSADVTCVDCHVSSLATQPLTEASDTKETLQDAKAPSHSFQVDSEACVRCHGASIHEENIRSAEGQVRNVMLLAMADRAPELAADLKTAEQTNKSLQTMTIVSLGLGLGIGGMVGIVFMLFVGYVIQGRSRQ
jgi:hypothetical protein